MNRCIPHLLLVRGAAFLFSALPCGLLAADPGSPRATIEGRVSNLATGEFLERARLTVEGTTLETFTDAAGRYRLVNVPVGTVQLKTFFTGFKLITDTLAVAANQTLQHDIALPGLAPRATDVRDDASPIKLDRFVVEVSREMSGAALAINEQRFAPNLRNIVSVDEYGDSPDGNVAEFLKFLPGVSVDSNRQVSINGVSPNNVPVTMGGFAAGNTVGTGNIGSTDRSAGLDLFSTGTLSRIEVSYSPTPETEGSALAGSVNLVPRSSLDRSRPSLSATAFLTMHNNGRGFHWPPTNRQLSAQIFPGLDFSYLRPVNSRFGFTLSGGFSKQSTDSPARQNTWRGVGNATGTAAFPSTTIDRPYLSTFSILGTLRLARHHAMAVTADYKFSPNDRITFALQYSEFSVKLNSDTFTANVNRVLPGQFTATSTRGDTGQGSLARANTRATRANWSYLPTLRWRHDGPVWKAEGGAGFCRADNNVRNLADGVFGTTNATRSAVTVAFNDVSYYGPKSITVTDAAGGLVNPFILDSYAVTQGTGGARRSDDLRRTAFANVGRDFTGRVPFSLKAGVDLRQVQRDQRVGSATYTFVGADRVASTTPLTGDDQAAPFLDPNYRHRTTADGYPTIQAVASEKLYADYIASPTHFTTNANTTYQTSILNSKYSRELISSAYLRGDLPLFKNRLKLIGGVRAEQTNINAAGPLTDVTRNVQRNAQGAPILGANGRPQPITTDPLQTSILTYLDRGARVTKEYLRLFPSLNASYNLTENLIARGAAYTSVGRPDFNQYSGGVTLPDTDRLPAPDNRIVVNNAAIKAWTAHSSMLRLEYYFPGVGQITAGVFRRDFQNFFGNTEFAPTPEFLALYGLTPAIYGAYNVATQYNIPGRARMQGFTASYKQALTFLPTWARGVQVFANLNSQKASGDATSNFSGYEPRSANWGASLTRSKYVVRVNFTNTSPVRRGLLTVQPGVEPNTYTWTSRVLLIDFIAEYKVYKSIAVFANMRNLRSNVSNTEIYGPNTPPQARFRQESTNYGGLWTFGLKGSF